MVTIFRCEILEMLYISICEEEFNFFYICYVIRLQNGPLFYGTISTLGGGSWGMYKQPLELVLPLFKQPLELDMELALSVFFRLL